MVRRRRALRAGLTGFVASLVTVGCAAGDDVAIPAATVAPSSTATTEAPTTTETSTTVVATTTTTEATTTTEPVVTEPPATAPPTPPPPTPPPTVEDPFLRIGDEGPAVARMQAALLKLDYLGPGYTEGVFDRATADALIDFQAQYGLVVDSIFGPETDRSLAAAANSVTPDP